MPSVFLANGTDEPPPVGLEAWPPPRVLSSAVVCRPAKDIKDISMAGVWEQVVCTSPPYCPTNPSSSSGRMETPQE